jgi:archaellum component FlaC
MASSWDADMQERFEKLVETVEAQGARFDAIDERFDAVDKRLDAVDKRLDAVDKRFDAVDKRFDAVDERFNAVDKRFNAVDKRFNAVDKRFDAIDERFDDVLRTIKVEREHTHEMIAKATEGYGATLERIERVLQEAQRDWQDKFTLHDRALTDHAARISALEGAKKP